MRVSDRFKTLRLDGLNLTKDGLEAAGGKPFAVGKKDRFPTGVKAYRGIPFDCGEGFAFVKPGSDAVKISFPASNAKQFVFLHACESPQQSPGDDGIIRNYKGFPELMTEICEYAFLYEDGGTVSFTAKSRIEINDVEFSWGKGGLLSKPQGMDASNYGASEDISRGRMPHAPWGSTQCRVHNERDWGEPGLWLYARENPRPGVPIVGIELKPLGGSAYLFGLTAGETDENPLRYGSRKKVALPVRAGQSDPTSCVDIDLGQIISVTPRNVYPDGWLDATTPSEPKTAEDYLVEFCSHEDAVIYYNESDVLRVRDIAGEVSVSPAEKYVTLRVLDENGKKTPVRVHAHGAAGEYLPPRNRHRAPNAFWFEDYGADFARGSHYSTYIDGDADYLLPHGDVFVEVSKGFEIKPLRVKLQVGPETDELTIRLERVIDWRKKGFATADTHVHFLSTQTALLEGEAEGVNVVNLLASQWGELFTNIGDFTGREGPENSNGEYMVKVGTENRQQIMGHISLIGYDGKMILPLTTDGPDESAIGDPMETTLTQWAEACRKQKGLNILPHFPNPRAENAAAIVSELIDAVEVTTGWGPHGGINPYYLSDWYRYLNCGYKVAAVGGTDKMGAYIAIGEMRTYAKLLKDELFTYDAWKRAVAAGRTFATCGALADFCVEGREMGETIELGGAAKLAVEWTVASAALPLTSVELIRNGEIIEKISLDSQIGERSGSLSVETFESAWFALRIRGRMPWGQNEIIAAHTSAIFVIIGGKPPFSGPDAATILDQIEGAATYVKFLGTKAREKQYKLALSALSGAHRALHNRMHSQGMFHKHMEGNENHKGHEQA